MKSITIILAAIIFSFFIQGCGDSQKTGVFKEYQLSGPFTFRNLSVFLVHGEDKIEAKNVLTLEEALDKKKAIIHETSRVNQLKIENISDKSTIYIQSGDIVKGGKQDRVLRYDAVIPPKSGKISIDAYCVEAGRWSQRGTESARRFASAPKKLVSRKAKLAAKHKGSQQDMWNEVDNVQKKLSSNLGKSVKSARSESSLLLSLENKDLLKEACAYVEHLRDIIDNRTDTVGFVFAISGEINSADIYSSKRIFKKLWPKTLESCSIEAISEQKKDKNLQQKNVTVEEVVKWLAEAEKGNKTKKNINSFVDMKINESEDNIAFETVAKGRKGKKEQWIHKNYIKKTKKKK